MYIIIIILSLLLNTNGDSRTHMKPKGISSCFTMTMSTSAWMPSSNNSSGCIKKVGTRSFTNLSIFCRITSVI